VHLFFRVQTSEIVGYFHWRIIFFVNLPIGLAGLYLVYLHLPDYKEEHTPPLDVAGRLALESRCCRT
jgi:hypothetical protein